MVRRKTGKQYVAHALISMVRESDGDTTQSVRVTDRERR